MNWMLLTSRLKDGGSERLEEIDERESSSSRAEGGQRERGSETQARGELHGLGIPGGRTGHLT